MDNPGIARILREIADLLEIKNDNPFKIRAYRNGADIAANHPHTLASLGRTYTEVHNVRDRREFMDGLKRGRGNAIGDSGDYIKLTRAVSEIGFEMLREKRWTTLLSPPMAAIPLVTLAHLALETMFAHKWGKTTGHGPVLRRYRDSSHLLSSCRSAPSRL